MKTTKQPNKTTLLVLLILIWSKSFGQTKTGSTSDFVIWNKAVIQVKRIDGSRFCAGAEFGYRRIDHAKAAQLILGLAFIGYTLPKLELDLTATYAFVHLYTFPGNADLYQLAVGRSISSPHSKLLAYAKLAVDRIFFPAARQADRWRYRIYFSARYPLGKELAIRLANEYLLTSLPGLYTSENRAQAGLYIPIGKKMEFGVAYLNRWVQKENAANLVEHTLLTEYFITL